MHPTVLRQRQEQAHERIMAAVKTLSKGLSLSPGHAECLHVEHRLPDVQQLFQSEAIADVLETLVSGREGQMEAIASRSTLPDDLPGRNALIRAGHTSPETVKVLTEDDLVAISGIGATRAKAIHAALNHPEPKPPKLAKTIEPHRTPEEALAHAEVEAELLDIEASMSRAEAEDRAEEAKEFAK